MTNAYNPDIGWGHHLGDDIALNICFTHLHTSHFISHFPITLCLFVYLMKTNVKRHSLVPVRYDDNYKVYVLSKPIYFKSPRHNFDKFIEP